MNDYEKIFALQCREMFDLNRIKLYVDKSERKITLLAGEYLFSMRI